MEFENCLLFLQFLSWNSIKIYLNLKINIFFNSLDQNCMENSVHLSLYVVYFKPGSRMKFYFLRKKRDVQLGNGSKWTFRFRLSRWEHG